MKNYFVLFLKGIGMGAANVIPGVSGGTIALITGIFEKLIDSIKSFDLNAAKLLFTGKFKEFANHVNMDFLIAVFAGVGVSIFSLAKLLDYLFINYDVYVWAYFFGLILASAYFVGKTIDKKLSVGVIITFLIGTASAYSISVLNPATENASFWYVFICGIIAVCSMILPGLSGSFVLILLGNYQLIMIDSIKNFNLEVLFPLIIGAGFGLVAFSHFLSWVFKKYKDQTISLLTGFILGSLGILWPWKEVTYLMDQQGEFILKKGEPIINGYQRIIPDSLNGEVVFSILLMITGIVTIWLLEKFAEKKS